MSHHNDKNVIKTPTKSNLIVGHCFKLLILNLINYKVIRMLISVKYGVPIFALPGILPAAANAISSSTLSKLSLAMSIDILKLSS